MKKPSDVRMLHRRALWGAAGLGVVSLFAVTACQVSPSPPATSQAAPLARSMSSPSLPEGYDWSLLLGERFELTGTRPVTISAEEAAYTRAYFAACEAKLGKFPLDDFNCSDARDMPVTGARNVGDSVPRGAGDEGALPPNLTDIAQCDRPSLIYRDIRNIGCSTGSRIRRISTASTDWSYVCRKAHKFFADENLYSEIGLIGNNRSTGDTCFFAGRAAVNFDIAARDDATNRAQLAALTGQRMSAPTSDAGIANWSVPTTPGCTQCHSHGPWLNFPFVDGKSGYQELSWRIDDAGDPQVVYLPATGYTGKDGKPIVPARHPGMLYAPFYPSELAELADKPAYRWPVALRLDPKTQGAAMCTTCHHIGNWTYSQRYPRSVFHFQDAPSFEPNNNDRKRTQLYLANLTQSLRGSHNTRMLTFPWADTAAAQVPGFAILDAQGKVIRQPQLADVYRRNRTIEAAIDTIEQCGPGAGPCWTEHWTLARVEAEPLRYLQETCSTCHSATAKTLPRLTTLAEFKKGGNAWSRLNNAEQPHPPGGRLEASVLAILGRYLAQ